MSANRQDRELNCEQVVVDGYLYVACVFGEEVEGLFVTDMVEVLHEHAGVVDHVDYVQHQDRNVEAFLQGEVVGEVLSVLAVPDDFEDLVIG